MSRRAFLSARQRAVPRRSIRLWIPCPLAVFSPRSTTTAWSPAPVRRGSRRTGWGGTGWGGTMGSDRIAGHRPWRGTDSCHSPRRNPRSLAPLPKHHLPPPPEVDQAPTLPGARKGRQREQPGIPRLPAKGLHPWRRSGRGLPRTYPMLSLPSWRASW